MGAQRPQAHSLQPRAPAAQRALPNKAAPVAKAPRPAAAAVRRLSAMAPGRVRLGRAGSGGAGRRGPGKAAARAGRAKPLALGALEDCRDPDVAVVWPEQLAALRRALAAMGACAARGSDPEPGPSLASVPAAAACGAPHTQGVVGERAGPGARGQRGAAGFGLPPFFQRLPAQVRRTAAGRHENTDPISDPDPVPGASKSFRPPATTAAPAEARSPRVAQANTAARVCCCARRGVTIPIAPEPASKPAQRAEHGRAASGRVCKSRVPGAGRKAGGSKCQAPAALPVTVVANVAPPAPPAADAAPAAREHGARPERGPAAERGGDSLDKAAVAGNGRADHDRGRGGANPERNPEPKPPPRLAWLLGGASGTWEAAGRESCVRGTSLWGDLWRGPDLCQAQPNQAAEPLLRDMTGPRVDAGGLRVRITVRDSHDDTPALGRGACRAAGAGSAGDVPQERAENLGKALRGRRARACRAAPRQLRSGGQLRSGNPCRHRTVLCGRTRLFAAAAALRAHKRPGSCLALERKRLRCTLLACRSQTSELVMAARMRRHMAWLEVAPELPEVRLQLVAWRNTLLPARPMA